ncbi:hypothetical protein PRIPAC_88719, partial [Pristionchus pacificus]|uniref:Uncharacterized protein n=1 Tax=Pristionchus pacificus TaxID=54126 RepID=A0A2A6CXC1_PRIPA
MYGIRIEQRGRGHSINSISHLLTSAGRSDLADLLMHTVQGSVAPSKQNHEISLPTIRVREARPFRVRLSDFIFNSLDQVLSRFSLFPPIRASFILSNARPPPPPLPIILGPFILSGIVRG